MSGASGQRPGRTPAVTVPREQPTITAAEILENIRARESGKSALPRFDDAEQQRQEQRMQRIANMRTAPENRQAQLQQFARLAKTRMWSGSDGLRGPAVPPKAIAEHEDLYRLLSRLPTDFPVEGWEKLPCKRQLALMEKTDLSREEQWTFLNAPAVITTLGKIQDLQLNRTAYGLSAAQIERTSDELMLLANARLEANGVDSPFRETKAKQRFLRMLDMQEEEVMESVLLQGKEQLTGYEKLRYDDNIEHQANDQLHEDLTKLVKEDLNLLERAKGYNSTPAALDGVLSVSDLVHEMSEKYGVPSAAINTILFRELRFVDGRDTAADVAKWLGLRSDTSTGIAQVTGKTAIRVINEMVAAGITTYEELGLGNRMRLNEENRRDFREIWTRLCKDPAFNLEIATLNLLSCAKETMYKYDFENVEDEKMEAILARYNGEGRNAAEYGRECFRWYQAFKEYKEATNRECNSR